MIKMRGRLDEVMKAMVAWVQRNRVGFWWKRMVNTDFCVGLD